MTECKICGNLYSPRRTHCPTCGNGPDRPIVRAWAAERAWCNPQHVSFPSVMPAYRGHPYMPPNRVVSDY